MHVHLCMVGTMPAEQGEALEQMGASINITVATWL